MQREYKPFILRGTISGFKWTFIIVPLAISLSYLTNVLLGRMGPEVLGFYGLIVVAMSIINTFLLLGGANVINNFLPQLPDNQKGPFLLSYTAISLTFSVVALLALSYHPNLISLLFRDIDFKQVLAFLFILTPLVSLGAVGTAALRAEMDIKGATLIENLPRFITFFIVALFFSTQRECFIANYTLLLWLIILFGLSVSVIASISAIRKKGIFRRHNIHIFLLPERFWRFTLPFHVGTVFNFLLESGDVTLIALFLGVEDLGYYRAAACTAIFIRLIPSMITSVVYPTFCNFQSKCFHEENKRIYGKVLVYEIIISGLLGGLLIANANEILSFFGAAYETKSTTVLVILAASWTITFPFTSTNGALTVAYEHTSINMCLYLLAAILFFTLSLYLLPELGVLGLAIGILISRSVLFVISTVVVVVFIKVHFTRLLQLTFLCVLISTITTALYDGTYFPAVNNLIPVITTVILICVVDRYEENNIIQLAKMLLAG